MTVERLAVTHGPDAVLHNLKYCKLFVPNFNEVYDRHCGYVVCFDLSRKHISDNPTFHYELFNFGNCLTFLLIIDVPSIKPLIFSDPSKYKSSYTLRDAASVITEVVGEYSRWTTNTALLLMAIKLVSCIQY